MAITYADVSHHQGTIDWPAYAASHDRVMIKATGGATDGTLRYVDPQFAVNWRGAGAVGLRRGAYHYARNNNAGADEWAWFLDRLNAAGGLRPGDWLCYDQEDTLPGGQGLARQRTQEFIAAAVAAGHPDGEIYSGKWYLDPAGIRSSDVLVGWRRLWLSDYTAGQADSDVELPAGWGRDLIVERQFTDQATVAGIASPCDCSRVLQEWITQEDTMSQADVDAINAHTDTAVDARVGKAVADLLDILGRGTQPGGVPWPAADGAHPTWAVSTANARLSALGSAVAAVGTKVGALGDNEAKILTAVTTQGAAVLAAVAAIPTDHLPDDQQQALADAIAAKVAELGVQVDSSALLDALAGRLTQ